MVNSDLERLKEILDFTEKLHDRLEKDFHDWEPWQYGRHTFYVLRREYKPLTEIIDTDNRGTTYGKEISQGYPQSFENVQVFLKKRPPVIRYIENLYDWNLLCNHFKINR